MKLARILASAAAAALFFATSSLAAKVGEKAPDFELTDIRGKTHQLSEYEGKVVVLEWTNYGCPYVKKYYDSGKMQELQAKMQEDGVVWLTICSSASGEQGHMDAAGWDKATKKNSATADVLIDESGKVGKAYNAMTTPHMYAINETGILVYNGAIDSKPTTRAADIDTAENYVVAAVKALHDGKEVAQKTTKPYGCSVKYVN